MRKLSSLFVCTLIVTAAFALASCNSESDNTPIKENYLPEVIAKDFSTRYGDNTIEHVYTGTDFYRHTGQQETNVYSKNKTGDELFVSYVDNVWNRAVQSLSDINNLPYNVRKSFSKVIPDTARYEFWEREEVTQACISGKYYVLCYLVYDSSVPSLHTLVIDSEGTVLKVCGYELNNTAYVRPLPTDIDWISEHYKGSVVLGYVNDMGDDDYLIMHNGVLKSVLFDSDNLDAKWKETRYALPESATVTDRVLDALHAAHPDFTYTEISVVESPNGNYYLFVDGTRPDRLGYYIEVN